MSDRLFEQLKAVRDNGTNLIDFEATKGAAEYYGYHALLAYLENHMISEYVEMLLVPFAEWSQNQAAVEWLKAQNKIAEVDDVEIPNALRGNGTSR